MNCKISMNLEYQTFLLNYRTITEGYTRRIYFADKSVGCTLYDANFWVMFHEIAGSLIHNSADARVLKSAYPVQKDKFASPG